MKERIYELASKGSTMQEVADIISNENNLTSANILSSLLSDGDEATMFHVGVLAYIEAPEHLLYLAAMDGDVEAINLLLKLKKEREIDKLVNDLF